MYRKIANNKKINSYEYEQSIVNALKTTPSDIKQISRCIGDQFISQKLIDTVTKLCDKEIIFNFDNNKYSISQITFNDRERILTIKTDKEIMGEGNLLLETEIPDNILGLEDLLEKIQRFHEKVYSAGYGQQIRDLEYLYVDSGSANKSFECSIILNRDYTELLCKLNEKEKLIIDKYKNLHIGKKLWAYCGR